MRVLRFSVFELDQSSGELTRSGRRVAIAAQSFNVLWLLASRSGDVVTREELRQTLWADGTHVDFDRGLNFCVAAARRALGDEARRPRFIETIPKRGYRFVAEVHGSVFTPAPAAPLADAAVRRSGVRRWAWAAALPFLIAQGPVVLRAHTRATAAPLALAAFERGDYDLALRLDARFAEAHYALAEQYKNRADRRELPARAALEDARVAVGRALALEEAPESRRLLGVLKLTVDWDWDGARRDFARALDLAPNWDLGLADYAAFLSASGDDRGALDAIAGAEAASPSCDVLFLRSAVLQYRARQYDVALEKLARAEALRSPDDRADREWQVSVHDVAFLVQMARRDWAAAHREAVSLAEIYSAGSTARSRFAAIPDRVAIARFLTTSADRTRPEALRGRASKTRVALLTALAGRDDEALAWLERAAAERDADLVFALRDPAFDALRALPRYQVIVDGVRSAVARPRPSAHLAGS